MRHYYTLGDTRYLPHLCTLLDSIRDHFKGEYTVHVLALDEKVATFITKRNQSQVRVLSLMDINEDFQIRAIRYLPASREALSNAAASNKDPGFVQYCWSLSSCFGLWLMERLNASVTYIDADIMFFSDIEPFFFELGNKSMGFVRHRIPYLSTSGEFNVGIVHFKNDGPGKSALRRWTQLMMDPNNSYSLGFGTCGDQKYLEVLQIIHRNDLAIIDRDFGHLAPWSVTTHQYDDGQIVWEGRKQNLIYFHFAHFVLQDNGYRASYANEWMWGDPLKVHPFVNGVYDVYYEKMKLYSEEILLCE